MFDIASIGPLRHPGETVIPADHDADTAIAHLLIGTLAIFHHTVHTHGACGLVANAPCGGFVQRIVDESNGGTDEHPVFVGLEQIERFFIGKLAVVDHVDTAAHRPLHRFRGARMACHALAETVRHVDGGTHFILAHHRHPALCCGHEIVT